MPPAPFNPYPDMLYSELGRRTVAVGIHPKELPGIVAAASQARLELVVHQHWTGWVLGGETDRAKAEARLENALGLLDSVGDAPLLWTLHNTMPHECPHPDLERDLRRELNRRATTIHVMNPETAEVAGAFYQLDRTKIRTIPHPSYRTFYPPPPAQAAARSRLGIEPDARWAAFVGQVRPYKRLGLLLDALEEADGTHLLVAGATGVDEESQLQSDRAAGHERVRRIDRHVDDRELVEVIAAADAIVVPYDQILNSGILRLAADLGRVSIVPDVPHLKAITAPTTSRYFSAGDPQSLAEAISVRHAAIPPAPINDSPRAFAALIEQLTSRAGFAAPPPGR